MCFVLAFVINHFSDTVQYESRGFLEKNRDTVSKELVNVFRMSKLDFCRKLMEMDDDDIKENPNTSGIKVVISAAKMQVS